MKHFFPMIILVIACSDDTVVETPFEGPGYDEVLGVLTEQDTPFVVGLTELHVKNAPGPGKRFGDHADAVGTDLYSTEPAGFIGGSFRNIGKLRWWTLTVWTDEAALTDFVLSEPHVQAMASLSDVAASARSTHTTFVAGGAPPTWDWALDVLETEPWIIGGD